MIQNKVKLVIWDLDDTFWQGTLEEGGITPIDRNADIVRALSGRGIVNSICSKNDFERTKTKLLEIGIWDHFVFPTISFNPKGKAIAEMIEGAALRAENVLFIDDNPMNLEEARFFNPGIMASLPGDVLPGLLEHPNLAGKPDTELTRLKQYRFLQRKVEERGASAMSNEEFLRASNIRVTIDYDVATNFDRVVELLNRTNQLNYTKQRLNTAEDVEAFRELLDAFGYHAGCVRVVDNYGDYGLVGFFLLRRRSGRKKLAHFAFSCRTMNMGIEQYIYDLLERPDIEIAQPVSYGLDLYSNIDWIKAGSDDDATTASARTQKLLLLGGCDLLQLASYCSANRVEFVNEGSRKSRIRYDDPSFVLSDREAVRECEAIRNIPCWTYEDALRFDEALASSELVLVSMWPGMNGKYYKVQQGFRIRLSNARTVRKQDEEWFYRNFEQLSIDDDERLKLIIDAFDSIGSRSGQARIFVIGCSTLGASKNKDTKEQRRIAYNAACRHYCAQHPSQFHFVDVDAVVPSDSVIGNGHFSRAGYFALARHILSLAGSVETLSPEAELSRRADGSDAPLAAAS